MCLQLLLLSTCNIFLLLLGGESPRWTQAAIFASTSVPAIPSLPSLETN
jgi:hypothetical protein